MVNNLSQRLLTSVDPKNQQVYYWLQILYIYYICHKAENTSQWWQNQMVCSTVEKLFYNRKPQLLLAPLSRKQWFPYSSEQQPPTTRKEIRVYCSISSVMETWKQIQKVPGCQISVLSLCESTTYTTCPLYVADGLIFTFSFRQELDQLISGCLLGVLIVLF